MSNSLETLYQPGMSKKKQLAEQVLYDAFGDKMPSIPIDPFKLMRNYGIVYQFVGFKNLEGIYLSPKDSDDTPIVGINYKRPITRQETILIP